MRNDTFAHAIRSTYLGYGKYNSTLTMSELWNRLQGADCYDKWTPKMAKICDRIGEDRDAADLLSGLQNHTCSTSAQSVFGLFS